VLTGDYGTFKSFLALDWALHLATGKRWHNDPRGSE
jgi:RecA-family ATPase